MAESASHTLYRPPAEAGSVIIRVADGCPHNACAFCAMYRGVPYREYDRQTLERSLALAAATSPQARRFFLADGDVLAMPAQKLSDILEGLRNTFPLFSRVTCYASGQALAGKSDEDLRRLRRQGLHTVYLGLESGSEPVLELMRKGGSAAGMVEGCRRAQDAGLTVSVMVLVGIGGRELSARHVRDTVAALNAMQPRLLSCLRLVPVPGTPLARWIGEGKFAPLSEEEAARELRDILSGLELERTVFRADHSSNILPLAGRLPRDKTALLDELDELLECKILDREGPGPLPAIL